MAKRKDDDEYEVGYGKPPRQKQFKPGQSGNPRGRPKQARGFDAAVARELDTNITIAEGGVRKTISKSEAAAKRLVEKALKGDLPSLRYLAETDRVFAKKLEGQIRQLEVEKQGNEIEPVDDDILSHFASMVRDGSWAPDAGGGRP